MASASKAKNLVIAMSLSGAALLALNRWALPHVFDLRPITDGAVTYTSNDARLRSVVWSVPQAWDGGIETPERESSIAISPDGRWLAYVSGAAGSDSELWLAAFDGVRASEARSITEINSPADEIAPCWSSSGLYFASNRGGGAGGFDLYFAPFDGGVPGAPVAVEHGVNGPADDVDPALLGASLVFASNRGGDFDLYVLGDSDDSGRRAVTALAALSSRADEREPCVVATGRALYFASNRERGGEDFDLWRSFRERELWLAPEALAGLDTPTSERAPRIAADGFTLYCDRRGPGGDDLAVAHTIELFRGAEMARGWADLLLMAALLALALVAALSKRWEELDLLYKCLLASVLLHILILILLRYLVPEAELWNTEREREPTFRVRLEAPRARALVERGGELESARMAQLHAPALERATLGDAPARSDAPAAATPLERTASAPAASPERAQVDVERGATDEERAAPELAQPAETVARRSANAAQPASEAPRSTEAARAPREIEGPVAAVMPAAADVDDRPAAEALTRRSDRAASDASAPSFAPTDVERSASAAHTPEVAQPSESRPRLALGDAPAPQETAESFSARRSSASPAEAASGPLRSALDTPSSSAVAASAALPTAASLERRERDASGEAAPAYRAPEAAPAQRDELARSAPEVSLPQETVQRNRASASDSAVEAPAAPAAIAAQRNARLESGPSARAESAPERSATAAPERAPEAQPLTAERRSRDEALPTAPRRLDDTPYRSRFGTEKEVALREHGGTAETERAVAAGLRYLASRQRPDGAWGSPDDRIEKYRDVRVGKSALALLAFLGAGHTPSSGTEHAAVAERAVRWLLSTQDGATGHFGDSEAYSHGIATYALAECCAITADARLRPAIERAVAQILRHQVTRGDARRVGGWGYFYPDGATFDAWPRTSITAWQVMALESARLGGLDVPDTAFEHAAEFLRAAWDRELERFRYNHDPARLNSGYATLPGSTPAALFALSLLGEDITSNAWRAALSFVNACAPSGYRWSGEEAFVHRAQGNLYFWYYGSLALLRHGGAHWDRWNAALKESLPPAQAADGSWAPIDVYCQYAGDDDEQRIYSTAMCVLSLEVYYRYFTPLLRVK